MYCPVWKVCKVSWDTQSNLLQELFFRRSLILLLVRASSVVAPLLSWTAFWSHAATGLVLCFSASNVEEATLPRLSSLGGERLCGLQWLIVFEMFITPELLKICSKYIYFFIYILLTKGSELKAVQQFFSSCQFCRPHSIQTVGRIVYVDDSLLFARLPHSHLANMVKEFWLDTLSQQDQLIFNCFNQDFIRLPEVEVAGNCHAA